MEEFTIQISPGNYVTKKANNIDMTPRADNSVVTTSSGDKIRVVSGNSSDKLRVKFKQ